MNTNEVGDFKNLEDLDQEEYPFFLQNPEDIENCLFGLRIPKEHYKMYDYAVVKMDEDEVFEVWAGNSPNLNAEFCLIYKFEE